MLRGLRLLFLAFWKTLLGRILGRPRREGWPFQFEMVVRYLRLDWEETADWDLARLRADMESRPYPRNFAKRVTRLDTEVSGVPVCRFRAESQTAARGLILFLHGGSYLFGSSKTTHCEVISRLACESGLEVVAPDFRLLPDFGYPAQLEDVLAVFRGLVKAGTPPSDIIVVGDSSGGNLATELALELRKRGEPQPKALGLVSPWCDLEMPGSSFVENDRYDFGTRDVLVRHARAFAGKHDLGDARISPTNANLTGLCPCLVIVGDLELPRDDILAFSEKLTKAGVEVELHVAAEMPHNPPAFAGLHPEGDASIAKLASYALAQLNSSEHQSP